MQITASAISLNVPDAATSGDFLQQYFGFDVDMSSNGFVSLSRSDAAMNVIFLDAGLGSFKPASHAGVARDGILIVFVVDDIDAQWERLKDVVEIATPIETEPWGERYFQVLDPNGVILQLVQWLEPEWPAGE
jgi:uncharacterized glyoxalase superfamily protein PhnB